MYARVCAFQYVLDDRPRAASRQFLQVPARPCAVHDIHDALCNFFFLPPSPVLPLTSPSLSAPASFAKQTEFSPRLGRIGRRPRAPSQRPGDAIPNDLCGVLRPPQLDPAGAAVAAVDVPAQVRARGARGERGQLGAPDPGHAFGRARERLGRPHHADRAFFPLFP